jgi:hypothetical protein
MPLPTPTDEDVNYVREVAGELDAVYVGTLVDALNDAQWDRALQLVDLWNLVTAGDLIALDGGRDGLRISDQEGLDDIRRRMRLLLGLPEFRDASLTGGPATTSAPVLWVW